MLSLRNFELARRSLYQEQDFIEMIQKNRVSRLVHKVLLNRRQRLTTRYALKYTITEQHLRRKIDLRRAVRQPFKEDLLVQLLDPDHDHWDRRLIYEVTGRRSSHNDFADDTSMDSEERDDTERRNTET